MEVEMAMEMETALAVVGQADTAAAVPVVALDMQPGGPALAAEKRQERVDMATVVADLEPAALKAAAQAAVLVPAEAMAQSRAEDMGTVQGRVHMAAVPDITQANLPKLLEVFLRVPVNGRKVPVAVVCSARSVPLTVRKIEPGLPQLQERGTL